jgi:hypothetical protein
MATQLDISDRSIWRILKEDLGLKSYKKRKLHGQNAAQIKNV